MLEISKHSWHYRLWKLGRESWSEPKNLCKYFWHIAIVKILIPLVIVTFVLLGISALLWLIWGHPVQSGLVVLCALVAAGLVMGAIHFGPTVVEHRAEARAIKRMNKLEKPKKKPNVVWEFIKARKRKVCPLIQVVDD